MKVAKVVKTEKPKPQRRRKSKSEAAPPPIRGELRDLAAIKTVAESQAERDAFFARAWKQKETRQSREFEEAIEKRKRVEAEAERVARAKRIAAALSDSDSD